MFNEHRETLRLIASRLHSAKVEWALGGSALLALYDLADQVNDLDLLVAAEDAERAHDALKPLGAFTAMEPREPFCTAYYARCSINGTGVDMMSLFGIRHEQGVYRLDWHAEEADETFRLPDGDSGAATDIPLSALEDWYVLYSLIPGRMAKAERIARYWTRHGGPARHRLQQALARELPDFLRDRVLQLLQDAGQ
ncbi:hypothetical protein SAMN02799630_02288 [Paenibacillus sp. UNCCL117]|uniref:hypothetical protein n=1 Tax=unclassified Paenibacillus TaxID=185978 RepID=UPI00087E0902|nr:MULTISPECIES: hypothetical protein [unclassified Paenibacillus]SDD16390.1 hypothetical protein SAMN04488602_106164 [Paenibacillus sp. cl123]SFW34691.1 hypothetical protein SAMN02799630_02288 [Paenibacillus sp. UNCCL117]